MTDILRLLRELWFRKQAATREQYDRTLPLADYVIDRWERASALGFGSGSSVYDSCLVLGRVNVGKNVWIGPNTILDGSGGLTIGDNCCISAGVQIYTHDTVARTVSGGTRQTELAPTSIGTNSYIGPNTVVAKGVTVGDRVVIGANSLVLKDIPSNSKAFGTPCVVRGLLDV